VNYLCFIHPEVSLDLRSSTDVAGWRVPQNYGLGDGLTGLISGELGTFENVRFVETPRVTITGSGSTKAYNTYVLGKEALAEAVAEEFHVVANGVITDPLLRKTALGWYGIAGWSIFRPQALWAIKSQSSVAS
jgi:N4-gp56 family major capsid protein